MKKDENMEWEGEAPRLAGLSKTTPYRVPDNYFNDLQERIHQSIFVDGLMQKESQGFSVPQHYFEDLGAQIQSRVALEQLRDIVQTDGFKTPANYFDKLNAEILSKTSNSEPKRKVVKLWNTDFMRYAAAACFILVVATGLYVNQLQNAKAIRADELANEQILYDIDESVIIEHIQETQTAASIATDAEMENYILDNFSSTDLSNNL